MYKKIAVLFLILAVLLGVFSSCKKEPEEGTINSIDLGEQEDASEEPTESYFTKLDSPFPYEYLTFKWEKARMRFDVPAHWTLTFINSRYIRIESPSSDPFLPGVTLNILANYSVNVNENELSEYTQNHLAYKFSDYFRDELPGLWYLSSGKNCHLRKYIAEDVLRNGLDFATGEHEDDAATLITDRVVMMDSAANYYSDFSFIATYVKWEDAPYCFSMVVPKELSDNASMLTEYIVSSISEEPISEERVNKAAYEDFETVVPNSFTAVAGAENIFSSPLTANTETAGMAVAVFKVEDKKTITAENIDAYYGATLGYFLFKEYDVQSDISSYVEEKSEGPDYTGFMTVNCSDYKDPTEIGGTVFGPISEFRTDYYIKEKGDDAYMLVVVYQKSQKDIASRVAKDAVDNFKVNK